MNDVALASLVSSRICHDLISPVGAIGNGIELMQMSPVAAKEEIELIADCAQTASAALQFMRVAFGSRDPNEVIALHELMSLTSAYFLRKKVTFDWSAASGEEFRFGTVQPLLMLALVGASTMPRGGVMRLVDDRDELIWRAEAEVIRTSEQLQTLLAAKPAIENVAPGEVHVLILWHAAEARGQTLHWQEDADGALLRCG